MPPLTDPIFNNMPETEPVEEGTYFVLVNEGDDTDPFDAPYDNETEALRGTSFLYFSIGLVVDGTPEDDGLVFNEDTGVWENLAYEGEDRE